VHDNARASALAWHYMTGAIELLHAGLRTQMVYNCGVMSVHVLRSRAADPNAQRHDSK